MTSLSLRFLIYKIIDALLDCSFTCPIIGHCCGNIQCHVWYIVGAQ